MPSFGPFTFITLLFQPLKFLFDTARKLKKIANRNGEKEEIKNSSKAVVFNQEEKDEEEIDQGN